MVQFQVLRVGRQHPGGHGPQANQSQLPLAELLSQGADEPGMAQEVGGQGQFVPVDAHLALPWGVDQAGVGDDDVKFHRARSRPSRSTEA